MPMANQPDPASTAAAARPALLRQLDDLEFSRSADIEYRLDGALRCEASARRAGAPDLAMRARLVQADMLQRKGQSSEAAAAATEVNRWARENGPQLLLARSHVILAAIFENIGDSAGCLESALRAVELLDDSTPPRTRADYLARLADGFTLTGSFDSARERYVEAQRVFVEIGDVERQLMVFNNLAYSRAMAGDLDQAKIATDQMQALATEAGVVLSPTHLDTVARVHIGRSEFAAAEAVVQSAFDLLARSGDVQAVTPGELTLTLAEVQRRQGRFADAQRTLDQCRQISTERALAGLDVDILREQAELYAATGELGRAYETYKLYHDQAMTLSSKKREAAARTRQALFETAEARQQAQRYWRQARTDELTRLPNRRFVDEELPRLLAEASTGRPLAVAIVDADHFKRINDTLSHEVGDRVIVALAQALQAAVLGNDAAAGPGEPAASDDLGPEETSSTFVARLGGEEFLIVLPGLEIRAAADLLERVRVEIEGHGWRDLVGNLPVSVSIGVTVAMSQDGQSELLARADRSLYAAKRSGRNRVVVDRGTGRPRPYRPGGH